MTDAEIIEAVIEREGGFVDDPADSGRETNMGITIATLSDWLGRKATREDVRTLSKVEAATIYRVDYIERPGFWKIKDDSLRELVIDTGVNMGPGVATRLLQSALGVKDDGVFGPVTQGVLTAADPKALYFRMCAQRARKYGRIITDNPKNVKFAAGWMGRLAEFIERMA